MMVLFNILMIIVAIFLLSKRIRVYDSIVNHLFFFTFVWITIIIGAQLSFPGKILDTSLILYYCCLFAYILGSSIINQRLNDPVKQRKYSFRNLSLIVGFLVINCFIANMDLLQNVVFNFTSIEAWVVMRKTEEFKEIDESNIYKQIFQRIYLIYIPLCIFLMKNKKMSKFIFIPLVLTAILFSILRFTRAPFMALLIMMLVSYVFIYRVKVPVKYFSITVIVIFIVFGFSQFFLLKDNANASNLVEDLKTYLFGGPLVFQDILDGSYLDNEDYDIKLYSFDFLNYILEKIGIIDSYPSYVREWSSTRTTNTYTYLDAFTLDFGVVGAVVGSFFTGLLSDFSYKLIKKNNYNLFNIIFYGNICFFNIFVFANNEFVRFSLLLLVVILLILNFLTKKITYE